MTFGLVLNFKPVFFRPAAPQRAQQQQLPAGQVENKMVPFFHWGTERRHSVCLSAASSVFTLKCLINHSLQTCGEDSTSCPCRSVTVVLCQLLTSCLLSVAFVKSRARNSRKAGSFFFLSLSVALNVIWPLGSTLPISKWDSTPYTTTTTNTRFFFLSFLSL